jgi:undecaprenyl-diphosphatase
MKKINKNIFIGGGLFVLFAIFTCLVKFVDVKAIGPLGSKVGLAGLNELFMVKTTSSVWDLVCDAIMVLAIASALVFVTIGVIQLIKRKSLKKVDKNIYVLAGLYAVVVIVYVLFELVVINYRPVLENGELAASYPSSHVLISMVLVLSSLIQARKYLKNNKKLLVLCDIIASVLVVALVAGRMLSGVHWITDIIASLLISGALIYIYKAVLEIVEKNNTKDKTLD